MKITFGSFSIDQTRSIFYKKVDTKEKALKLLEKAIDDPKSFVISIRIYRDL